MPPTIRQPSTVDNLLSLPRRLRRSRPRRRGRLCSSGSRERAHVPTARDGSIPDVWNRALLWRGGAGRSSRLHPPLAEDLLARQLLRHALLDQLSDTPLLLGRDVARRGGGVSGWSHGLPLK